MGDGPAKKKIRLTSNENKRKLEETNEAPKKKFRTPSESEVSTSKNITHDHLASLKRQNFPMACEQVSFEKFFDYRSRYMLAAVPECAVNIPCSHRSNNKESKPRKLPDSALEGFRIDLKAHTWCDALDVCEITLKPGYYLSSDILQNIVDIILNAHHDDQCGYSIQYLLNKCQHILMLTFNTHPPCDTTLIDNCYKPFLLKPQTNEKPTFSNRDKFCYDKGIAIYCFNRLNDELSSESKDEPIVNKYENTPDEMKQSLRGLYWQKDEFEIYEALNRTDRINRLFKVLECILDLLQRNLAIWQAKFTSNPGKYKIMRSNRPLMMYVLWSDIVLYTGAVNANCRLIMKLFIDVINLEYPQHCIDIMTKWMNLIAQTIYLCENNVRCDYPNFGNYSNNLAKEFCKLITDFPVISTIKILECIQPDLLRYLIGMYYLQTNLNFKSNSIIELLKDFLKKRKWHDFKFSNEEIIIDKPTINIHSLRRLYSFFTRINENNMIFQTTDTESYPKHNILIHKERENEINRNEVIMILYLTFDAYLKTYSIDEVYNRIEKLNESLGNSAGMISEQPFLSENLRYYNVSNNFKKHYRDIFQQLQDLILIFINLKDDCDYTLLKVFECISVLSL